MRFAFDGIVRPHIKHPDNTRVLMVDVINSAYARLYMGDLQVRLALADARIISVIACVLFEALTQLILKRR